MPDALDPSVLDALKKYDAPTLSNAIELFDVRPRDEGYMSHDIRCMFPDLGVMVGYAATATMRARGASEGYSPDDLTAHVQGVPGPRIVVVQDLDDQPAHGALWGEVMATTFTALGCLGDWEEAIATDGSFAELDRVFHCGLVKATQNTVLLRLVNIFYLMTQRRREYFFRGLDRRKQSFAEHQKIFEAVVERDEERAVALLDIHLQGADSYWQDLIGR